MEAMKDYLGDIDYLVQSSTDGSKDYIHPALKNLGCVTLVTLREAIAPVIFRNAEQEITDIEIGDDVYIRAVPNKFKFPERSRGLQILRSYGVGGRMPQNKTVLKKGQKPSEAFDLNTLVFGDSANQENKMLPVKAAVNYSDGLSLQPKHLCIDETFHNRGMEDGTLFDAAKKTNSELLFSRHFILPGTLMIQVLSTRGKVLPTEGFDHLLLAIGLAGVYGGQTSVTGVNLRTRLAGLYGSRFEKAQTSPYEIVKFLSSQKLELSKSDEVIKAVHGYLAPVHEQALDSAQISNYQQNLVTQFENSNPTLGDQYHRTEKKVAELFDQWFGTGK